MNIFRSYVHRLAAAAFAAVLAGCGPDDGSAEFEAGKAAFEVRDYKKAERLFAKCAELAPGNVDAFVYLARAELALGNLQNASKWIAAAENLAPEAPDVRLLSAQIAWHVKDFAKATALFSGIAGDTALPAALRAEGWTGCGLVDMAMENAHLARVCFLSALRFDSTNAPALYHLGLVYRDKPFGYFEAARDCFSKFVWLAGQTPQSDQSIERVQTTQRSIIPELQDSITRAAAERPGASSRNSATCADAISKAEAAKKKGAHKAARQAYQEALAADTLSYQAALGLAEEWLASDSSKDGQIKALEAYRLACALRSGAVKTSLAAGALAMRLGMYAQATEIYSRAVAANPTSLDAIDGLIKAMRKMGGHQKDAAAYQRYRDLLPASKASSAPAARPVAPVAKPAATAAKPKAPAPAAKPSAAKPSAAKVPASKSPAAKPKAPAAKPKAPAAPAAKSRRPAPKKR